MLIRFSASFIVSSNSKHCFVSDKMCFACDPRPGVVRFLWSNSKWLQRNLENVKQAEWSFTNPLPLIIGMYMSAHTSTFVLRICLFGLYLVISNLSYLPFIRIYPAACFYPRPVLPSCSLSQTLRSQSPSWQAGSRWGPSPKPPRIRQNPTGSEENHYPVGN